MGTYDRVFGREQYPDAVIFTEDACRHKSLVRGYQRHYPGAKLICWRHTFVANIEDLPLKEIDKLVLEWCKGIVWYPSPRHPECDTPAAAAFWLRNDEGQGGAPVLGV